MLTCSVLAAAILAASPGAVLTLAPGQDCPAIKVAKRTWAVPVTVVAKGATVRGLTLDAVNGLTWVGGTIKASGGLMGSGPAGYAMNVKASANLRITGTLFTEGVRGLVVADSEGVEISANQFRGLRSDGVNLAAVRKSRVLANRFREFLPRPTTCTAGGQVTQGLAQRVCVALGGSWKDGDHPDAIQMWGHPTADIVIAGNDVAGDMQSIGFFGASTGAPARVRIENNVLSSAAYWGISLQRCTDCAVTGNRLSRFGDTPRKVKIVVTGSTGRFCGNSNPDAPKGDVTVGPCTD